MSEKFLSDLACLSSNLSLFLCATHDKEAHFENLVECLLLIDKGLERIRHLQQLHLTAKEKAEQLQQAQDSFISRLYEKDARLEELQRWLQHLETSVVPALEQGKLWVFYRTRKGNGDFGFYKCSTACLALLFSSNLWLCSWATAGPKASPNSNRGHDVPQLPTFSSLSCHHW